MSAVGFSPFSVPASDGQTIAGWVCLPAGMPRSVVLIVHGLGEHSGRYQALAQRLAANGHTVYGYDQRGHGERAGLAGYFADRHGWPLLIEDARAVLLYMQAQHPDVPCVLLGHSMGSLIARQFFQQHGGLLQGLVLSATAYRQRPLAASMRGLARLSCWLGGARRPSLMLAWLVFGSFNLGFWPTRTRVDWLSRDKAQVDAYLADPLCGRVPTAGLWRDLFGGIVQLETAEAAVQARHAECRVLLMAGSRDPVSFGKLALQQLAARYARAGIAQIHTHVYPGGRHEMLNETNQSEVEADLLRWLDACSHRA